MARVIQGMASVGYVGTWWSLRASDIGAPHQRERVFISAHPADAGSERHGAREDRSGVGRLDRAHEAGAFQRQWSWTFAGHRGQAAATADAGSQGLQGVQVGAGDARPLTSGGDPGGFDWRGYADAIRRWERILGRVAPLPAIEGRENPEFVEWMMGLPAGHVTDVPGITRNESLKALGNGVVPQQAAEALRVMLSWEVAA